MPSYLLLSSASNEAALTRNFNEFSTKNEVAETIVDHFESYLEQARKLQNPENDDAGAEWSSDDLFDFIDNSFAELVCLEQQEEDLWIPYSTDWIKETINLYLRSLCKNDIDDDQIMEIAID